MCFICEYTTVPRILSNNATANVSRVNRKVIANTRTGIPTQRGPAEFVFAMLLGYTNSANHRDGSQESWLQRRNSGTNEDSDSCPIANDTDCRNAVGAADKAESGRKLVQLVLPLAV